MPERTPQPASDPGLREAEAARRKTRRTPPQVSALLAVVGGVDEPGMIPVVGGDKLRVFMDKREAFCEALEDCTFRSSRAITSRILCKDREINN